MSSQGWKPGDALGSTSSLHHSPSVGKTSKEADGMIGKHSKTRQSGEAEEKDSQRARENAARLAAAHVGVLFKDDTLGLGARAGASDVEARSAGLDAFVGLLGRLNAKGQEEVEVVERVHRKKVGDGVLARYARGRGWGVVFVRGGVLRGGEEYGTEKELEGYATGRKALVERKESEEEVEEGGEDVISDGREERRQGKEEKRMRKEERRVRREAKAMRRLANVGASPLPGEERERKHKTKSKSPKLRTPSSPDEAVSDDTPSEQVTQTEVSKKRTKLSITEQEAPPKQPTSNGRHILRGRNIAAKRMAFSDTKSLDAIFMKR